MKGRGVNLEFENNRRVFEHQRLEPMVIGVRNWGQKTVVEFSFGEKERMLMVTCFRSWSSKTTEDFF